MNVARHLISKQPSDQASQEGHREAEEPQPLRSRAVSAVSRNVPIGLLRSLWIVRRTDWWMWAAAFCHLQA